MDRVFGGQVLGVRMYSKINCSMRCITANKDENKCLWERDILAKDCADLSGRNWEAGGKSAQRRQIIPDFPCNGTTHTFQKYKCISSTSNAIYLMIKKYFSFVDWYECMTAEVMSFKLWKSKYTCSIRLQTRGNKITVDGRNWFYFQYNITKYYKLASKYI